MKPAQISRYLVTVAVLSIAILPSAFAAEKVDMIRCGENILLKPKLTHVPLQDLPRVDNPTSQKMTSIVLNAGAGLAAQPAALAAWNQAIAIWESILQDPITITIDGDIQALNPGVLGSTSPQSYSAGWDTIFDSVKADAAADETVVGDIPNAAGASVLVPPGCTWTGGASASRANLSAVGVDMDAVDISIFGSIQTDAEMIFASGFLGSFDFDPSDGITPGRFDFVAIVVHEMGHALGFSSRVDYADFLVANSLGDDLLPTVLDGFRILPNTSGSFSTTSRLCQPGSIQAVQVMYDGLQELSMSTGGFTGDGNQASHWKADEISGTFIGIMDPTLAPGQMEEITLADIRAFGLIGYDVTNAPDCNSNGIADQDDIDAGTSEDCNMNSIPDECDISTGASLDDNGNDIPDECELVANDSPNRRRATIDAYPTPFNPTTTLRFYLPKAGNVQIQIYDVAGRWVDTLLDERFPAGDHDVQWRGRDSSGRGVRSGVYYAVYRTPQGTEQVKLTLLK